MNLDLKGRNALVCGSTQGLGFASAEELALLGANITLCARNEEKLKSAVMKLDTSLGQRHHFLVADFANPSMVESAIINYLNNNKVIHILVNNTGGPPGGNLLDSKVADYENAFQAHLICNHILATSVIPGMKKAGYGRVINIISTSVKQPIKGLAVSNTIRAAVASWSKTLASEVGAYGITVNNVLPGFTKTVRADYIIEKRIKDSGKSYEEVMKELLADIPAGRIGDPAEFGAAVAFLATPAAAYINGINLPVDGGRLGCL